MAPGIRRQALVACCVLLAFVMRGSDLVSDPPTDLEDSGGYFADEGFWTHNARNKVLFGEWVLDEWNNMYASPLTHWPQYLSFKLLGPGLAEARLLPAVLSAACCALLAMLPGVAGVLAAVLFALDALLLHFGRIALLETPLIFMILVSWSLLSGAPGRGRLAGAGLAAGLAVATKLSVFYFVPAALLALCLAPAPVGRWRSMAWFVVGLAVSVVVWVLLVGRGLPLFLQYTRYYASQQSPWLEQLRANLASPVLFARFRHSLPVTATGFVLSAGLLTPALRSRLPREVALACFWFVLGALYLNTLTYDPLRYYMPLLPALVIIVAWAAVEAWHGRLRLSPFPLGVLLCLLFLWPMAWKTVLALRPHATHWPRWRIIAAFLMVSGGVGGGWWIAALLVRRRRVGRVIACAVVLACVGMSSGAYLNWMGTRQRAVFTSSRELAARFPSSVFTGQWAPELCLETRHRAVPVWPGFINGEGDPFGTYGITHGVIWGRHWQKYTSWFPDDFARARILDTLWIKETPVVLCEFTPRPRAAPGDPDAEGAPPAEAAPNPEP
ncbi:glycosyltransferase family 39 protein [Candidatus Fermentibacteria bacterium]|nr:glycosyltransferase family 39 protein [Candidatus Fermentibacteria bacterium]